MADMAIDGSQGSFFKTLGEFCAALGGMGVQSERVTSLDEKIRELTSRKEKIKVTGTRIDNFCLLVQEINPYHTNPEFARQNKFDDRFAPGTMIASFGEQYANGLIESLNETAPTPYLPISCNVHFGRHVVYPETNLSLSQAFPALENQVLPLILCMQRRNVAT